MDVGLKFKKFLWKQEEKLFIQHMCIFVKNCDIVAFPADKNVGLGAKECNGRSWDIFTPW